jgi:hypothetical protein
MPQSRRLLLLPQHLVEAVVGRGNSGWKNGPVKEMSPLQWMSSILAHALWLPR